ncbi:MAG: DEAD/DEAH box helicase [Bacillota bacterium]
MNLEQLIEVIKRDPEHARNFVAWHVLPAQAATYHPFPPDADPRLLAALAGRGIHHLYSHQAESIGSIGRGENTVIVTPTASGKTLCYNFPILDAILHDPTTRALYLFPTKALAQDQVNEIYEIIETLGGDINSFTYDGDTAPAARQAIREAGHIVVTNPDMLHTGILPHHTKWVKLFENLKYVVIDEIHHYRGVFGSHLANVVRRLRRICRFYGSDPVFICCSATIANPLELATAIIGDTAVLVDRSGAPRGQRHIALYNPSVVNEPLGIRQSSRLAATSLARRLLANSIQTIVFARSRIAAEVIVTYLKQHLPRLAHRIRGYRGGYLPRQRREIEAGLRDGQVLGVVSTNALELGIDIGQLQSCIICGFPGTIASTWQQMGRAGRRSELSLAILVADSTPADQYLMHNPEYFFGSSPEQALVNPNNLYILTAHLKCAAFELPFVEGEQFGVETTTEILEFLAEEGLLKRAGNRWYWSAESFPAEEISLRSAASDNFVIVDTTDTEPRVIGEMDRFGARTMLHDNAIYLHESQQYHVDRLDWEEMKAYVHRVDADYFTDANLAVKLRVLEELQQTNLGSARVAHGEVSVTAMATIYKKIKLHTHENIGWGKIRLPEEELHTAAYWVSVRPEAGQSPEEIETGLLGAGHLLTHAASLFLMCDRRDLHSTVEVRSPHTGQPTLFIYDHYPGGIGLAEKLYQQHGAVVDAALRILDHCPCTNGCPACVGVYRTNQDNAKELGERWLTLLREGGADRGSALPPQAGPKQTATS